MKIKLQFIANELLLLHLAYQGNCDGIKFSTPVTAGFLLMVIEERKYVWNAEKVCGTLSSKIHKSKQ